MDITIYRYRIIGSSWGSEVINSEIASKLGIALMEQPLYGDDPETQFGFTQCNSSENLCYGLFVQKFPTTLIDYDAITKVEERKESIDTGEYLFILDLSAYEVYLQTKKSSKLPNKDEILKRFISLLKFVMNKSLNLGFEYLKETVDEIDRDKVMTIFYTEAEKVTELELEDFDLNLIEEQKRVRGRRQTYFNPIEAYQEAMEAGAIRLSQHAEKTYVRAKPGEDLKKDPITRAMLEGSRKPVKITYVKEGETHTEFGVTKSKEKITVEGEDYDLVNQIGGILSSLMGTEKKKKRSSKKKSDDPQTRLDV